MSLFQPINLRAWIDKNRDKLKPPVGNLQVFKDERETIVMVVGGPNRRKDYHVNPTEELFLQIEGDITVNVIHPDTGKPHDIIIREGEMYLLPANVPHSPRRPAGTIGVVVEYPRPAGTCDKLQWYSDDTQELVYEREFKLENIEKDLKAIMDEFWSNENLRRNPRTGSIIAPPGEAQPPPPLKR